jgi:hypothetical protein
MAFAAASRCRQITAHIAAHWPPKKPLAVKTTHLSVYSNDMRCLYVISGGRHDKRYLDDHLAPKSQFLQRVKLAAIVFSTTPDSITT